MARWNMRLRSDDGATSVLVAILAVLLFGAAAFAVELTDTYSRDRAAQTVADVSAQAGGLGLPDSCAAATLALARLNDPANSVRNDGGPNDFQATAAQMSNRDLSDGEIQVLTAFDPDNPPTASDPSWLNTSSCGATGGVDTARFVRVVTPPRDKAYTLAQVFESSPEPASVRAVATSTIRSPSIGDTLPVFLPTSCNFGANYVITESPSAGGPAGTPNYTPNGVTASSQEAPVITSVTSSVVNGGIVQRVRITVSNLQSPPTATSIIFDFHTGTGGSTVRRPLPAPAGLSPIGAPTDVTGSAAPYEAVYEVDLPLDITELGGSWYVRGAEVPLVTPPSNGRWSRTGDAQPFSVEATSAPGCGDPATGDFGLLRADRNDTGNSSANELALNFIKGLDYSVSTIPTLPAPNTPCSSNGSPTTAILSTTNDATDGANCLAIESGGNRGPITSGFIEGAAGEQGRLFAGASPAVSGCSEPAGPGDSTPGDFIWRTPTNPTSVPIWNTQLSCYLGSGTGLGDLNTCDGCLDPSIIEDPRYFLVPVLNTIDRPSSSTQWPIKEFRGAFITNETATSTATCPSTRVCNGIEFNNGDQSIFALQVFVFPLSALPDEIPTTVGDGTDFTGDGPREFVLVE